MIEYEVEINERVVYAELVDAGEAAIHIDEQGTWLEIYEEPKFDDFYYYKDEDLDNEQIQPDPHIIKLATIMMEEAYWDTYTEEL
jgi:hypothetical protein